MFDLQNIFMNILSMSTIASIVFFMILLVRKILKSKISPEKLSLLWIVFIITLIFPINFSSKLSIKNYIHHDEKRVIDIGKTYEYKEEMPLYINGNSIYKYESEKNDYIKILSIIWILFAVGSILKDTILYNTFIDSKSNRKIPSNMSKMLQKCKENLKIKNDIKLVIQDRIKTPSLHGILNIKILFTEDILKLSEKELECIVVHELNHYKRKHNILYLLLKILERIYWFNPIMIHAGKLIRQDLEILTDSLVIENGFEIKDYCRTIVKIAEISNSSLCLMPGICNEKKELERRIMLMKNKVIDSKYAFLCIVVISVVLSLVTISLASNKVENNNEQVLVFYSGEGMTKESSIEIKNENTEYNNIDVKTEVETESLQMEELVVPLKNVKITARFGKRIHPVTKMERVHLGVDVVSDVGDEVFAVADGSVILAEYDSNYGNHIKIRHKDGTTSHYAHASELFVKVGDKVKAGEKIMLVGSTGMATGPHLHFEMQNRNGEYIDVNSLFE